MLICEGNNKEGACDMLCQDVQMKCFYEGHNTSCVLGCEALGHLSHLSHARKCQMRMLMRMG